MEAGMRRRSPIRMLVTKQNELILPFSTTSSFHRQGVIFSEVSTPSGVKLVQLLLNQEKQPTILKQKDPIIFGVEVKRGTLRLGTPICALDEGVTFYYIFF